MVFGYTPLDPLVVIFGTGLAMWYLGREPVRLIGFMPTALSLWFFFPTVTNLTLWQTVPLLLTGRMLLKGGLRMASFAKPVFLLVVLVFLASGLGALIVGADGTRAAIRIIYYMGIFSLLSFAYEMGRKPECYEILLKGLVAMGIVYAAYGIYQIIAFYTGLPLRGIVYSASGGSIMAFEAGLLRINSLANEPKRLGYVLFIAAMACIFLARMRPPQRARQLRLASYAIFAVSFLTFAGSYFLTIGLFALTAILLYPSRATVYVFGGLAAAVIVAVLFPSLGLVEAVQHGYERRLAEVEVGLDGRQVYRQEFFAWDYLAKNQMSALTGVGVGQYFSVLNAEYGVGAGYNEKGGLMPLNSNFLELTFDLGGVVAAIVYASWALLILQLRRARETFLCLAMLFLLLQSLTILTLSWQALIAGVGIARLATRKKISPSLYPMQAGSKMPSQVS